MTIDDIIKYLKMNAVLDVEETNSGLKGNLYINYYNFKRKCVAKLDDKQVHQLLDMDILSELLFVEDDSCVRHFIIKSKE